MTPDEKAGMAWWNRLSVEERGQWLMGTATQTVAEAWAQFHRRPYGVLQAEARAREERDAARIVFCPDCRTRLKYSGFGDGGLEYWLCPDCDGWVERREIRDQLLGVGFFCPCGEHVYDDHFTVERDGHDYPAVSRRNVSNSEPHTCYPHEPHRNSDRDLFDHMASVRNHEAIERDAQQWERQVVEESTEAACRHEAIIVHERRGTPGVDDLVTELGQCRCCGAWVIVSDWACNFGHQVRLLTEREKDRLQSIDDTYRQRDAS